MPLFADEASLPPDSAGEQPVETTIQEEKAPDEAVNEAHVEASANEAKPDDAAELSEHPVEAESDKTTKPLLVRSREYLGRHYVGFTQTLDNFFSGTRLELDNNKSFLKAIAQTTWFEHSDDQYDFKLKGKVDLPHTKERLRLFIDSDPDEDNTLLDRNRSVSRGERVARGSSVAGIEFSKQRPLTRWRTSISLGGRMDNGFKPLVRARARRHWRLNESWTSYFHQDIWHLDGVGWGETSHLAFTRSVGERSWFQVLSEIEYQDDDPHWQYLHSWRFDHVLSDKHVFTYKVGLAGETPSGILEDNRFITFSWRSRIYQDWVFLHLTPEVYFAREDNYSSEAAFTVKFEIFLTD